MNTILLIIICIDCILNLAVLTSSISRIILQRKLSKKLDEAIRASYFKQIRAIKGESDEVRDDR